MPRISRNLNNNACTSSTVCISEHVDGERGRTHGIAFRSHEAITFAPGTGAVCGGNEYISNFIGKWQ